MTLLPKSTLPPWPRERYDKSSEHDLALVGWYSEMLNSGDLYTTLMPDAHSVGGFISFFYSHADLYFHRENGRIIFAWWVAEVLSGVFFGLWVAPELRRSRWVVEAVEESLAYVLERKPVVLSVTRQQQLLEQLRWLGYTLLGKVPGIWHGYDAWVLHLTKEAFDDRRRQRGRRRGRNLTHARVG